MITIKNKLTNYFAIAALSMGTLIACTDNANDKAADRSPITTGDSLAGVKNGTSEYDSKGGAGAASTASTVKAGKKKGKASVDMINSSANSTSTGSDKMMMDKEGVYNKATVMPMFPGGQEALATYVNNHVEYPQQAIDDNKVGTVKVSFVVDENGKVKNAKVISPAKVGDGLDEEAIRVVNNMPNWKPGKVKGKNVKTRLELPISFQLEA